MISSLQKKGHHIVGSSLNLSGFQQVQSCEFANEMNE